MIYVYIIMGVSGSGKTTIGAALASELNVPFYGADDYHPPENITKMRNNAPLNDSDRLPWLDRLHELIQHHVMSEISAVLACSALRQRYRDRLRGQLHGVQFIYLDGGFDLIWRRMQERESHYMQPEMLQSQFDVLEKPTGTEVFIVSIELQPNEIVEQILRKMLWYR